MSVNKYNKRKLFIVLTLHLTIWFIIVHFITHITYSTIWNVNSLQLRALKKCIELEKMMENFRMWNKKWERFGSETRLHQEIYYLIEIQKMCSLFFSNMDMIGFMEHRAHFYFYHQHFVWKVYSIWSSWNYPGSCECRQLKNGCVKAKSMPNTRMFATPEPS